MLLFPGMDQQQNLIIDSFIYFSVINAFPCVAAKDAIAKGNIKIMVAQHLAGPADDKGILNFILFF